MCQPTLPRRFRIILEKILDRHERSGIAVQWNGGGGGVGITYHVVMQRRNAGTNYIIVNTCTNCILEKGKFHGIGNVLPFEK